jgi:hypothetical protein
MPVRLAVAACLAILACASAEIDSSEPVGLDVKLRSPRMVVVEDFAYAPEPGPGEVAPPPPDEEALELGRTVSERLAAALVDELELGSLPVVRAADAPAPVPLPHVAVEGRLVQVDEGSAAARVLIGFGAGGSQVRSDVEVVYVSAAGRRLVHRIETSTTASRKPGMFATLGAGAAASGVETAAVTSSASALTGEALQDIEKDAKRSAAEIAEELTVVMADRGWIIWGRLNESLLQPGSD